MLKERVELLAIGEVLGYPRLGIGHRDGHKLAIKAGQPGWEQFAGHAHTTRIPAALRIGRILRDNGVTPYNPRAQQIVLTKEPDGGVTVTTVLPQYVIQLDEPMPELIDTETVKAAVDEMVKPKRSSAAVRQARYRANKKKP
jgi:hypothetical protein